MGRPEGDSPEQARQDSNLQPPVLEFGCRHLILYHLVPFCPILYGLNSALIPFCTALYHLIPCSWFANGLQRASMEPVYVTSEIECRAGPYHLRLLLGQRTSSSLSGTA